MRKNVMVLDRAQMTIGHIPCACRITKVTNTRSEYVIFIEFPPQELLRQRISVLRLRNIACRLALCEDDANTPFRSATQTNNFLRYRIFSNLIRTSFCRFLKRKKKVSSLF